MDIHDIETVAYVIQELRQQDLEPSFTAAMALCLYAMDRKTHKVNISKVKLKLKTHAQG